MSEPVADGVAQPIGAELTGWMPRPTPDPTVLSGATVRLERLEPRHIDSLYDTTCAAGTDARWTYMVSGPFDDRASFAAYCESLRSAPATVALAIVDQHSGAATGMACYLRIEPAVGSIEVGSIMFSPLLSGSRAATEAMYLMARHAFDDLGYRRYEWKCDALNEPSRRAARRLGFRFEGIFRQATIYKGRNRDTAWFSIIDQEWPSVRTTLEAWLDPGNFDADGTQKRSLTELGTTGE